MAKKSKRNASTKATQRVPAAKAETAKAPQRKKNPKSLSRKELSEFIENEAEITPRSATAMPPSQIPRAFVWLLGAFIGLSVVMAPYGQTASGYNPDYHISAYYQVGLSILMVLYFMFLARNGSRCEVLIPRTPLLLPFVFLVAWMAVTLFWATSFYEGWVKVLDWLSGLLVFMFILLIVRDLKSLRILLLCLFVSGLAMALLGVAQFLFSVEWVHQHAAPAAVFGNKNMAAQYMIANIPLGIALFFSEKRPPLVWLYAIGTVLMILMVFYSYTRGSLFAGTAQIILLALLFLYIKFRYKQRFHFHTNKSVALITSLILFAVMSTFTPTTFSEGTGGIDKVVNPKGQTMHTGTAKERLEYVTDFGETASQRKSMWLNSVEIIKDHFWFGTGIGNWMVFYPKYQATAKWDLMLRSGYYHLNAHNDYLEFFAELGIIGALLLLWFVFAVLQIFWKFLNTQELENDSRALIWGPLVSIAGISAVAIVSFPLQQIPTIILVSVSLAVIGVVYWHVAPHPAGAYHIKLPHSAARAGTLVALIIIAVLMLRMQIDWYRGEMFHRDGIAYMRLNKPEPFGILAKKAVDAHPWRKRHSLYLGHYYVGRKEYTKAIEQYERLLEDYPYIIEPRQNLAAAYFKTGAYQKADALLKEWAVIQKHAMRPQLTYAIFNYRVSRFDLAEKYAKRSIALYKRMEAIGKKFDPKRFEDKGWEGAVREYERSQKLLAEAIKAKNKAQSDTTNKAQ